MKEDRYPLVVSRGQDAVGAPNLFTRNSKRPSLAFHPSSFAPSHLNITPYFIAMSLASLAARVLGQEARICVAIMRI